MDGRLPSRPRLAWSCCSSYGRLHWRSGPGAGRPHPCRGGVAGRAAFPSVGGGHRALPSAAWVYHEATAWGVAGRWRVRRVVRFTSNRRRRLALASLYASLGFLSGSWVRVRSSPGLVAGDRGRSCPRAARPPPPRRPVERVAASWAASACGRKAGGTSPPRGHRGSRGAVRGRQLREVPQLLRAAARPPDLLRLRAVARSSSREPRELFNVRYAAPHAPVLRPDMLGVDTCSFATSTRTARSSSTCLRHRRPHGVATGGDALFLVSRWSGPCAFRGRAAAVPISGSCGRRSSADSRRSPPW